MNVVEEGVLDCPDDLSVSETFIRCACIVDIGHKTRRFPEDDV
jgi:hypothetical protein